MSTHSLYAIQITDTHLFARPQMQLLGVDTSQTLQGVLEAIAQLQPPPDLLLATGDLSQDGSPESYQRLRQALAALSIDTYWLPGNHDSLPAMEAVLGAPRWEAGERLGESDRLLADKTFGRGNWRFILLNSAVPKQAGGHLAVEQLERLEQQLSAACHQDRHVLICLHHPPFLIESKWLDTSTLANPTELFAVLDRFDCVRAVLFGHVHQAWNYTRRGVKYLACPSTCVQFQPRSDRFSLEAIAPGVRQLWFYPDGRFESKVLRVEVAAATPDALATGY
ncbi:3',5'-cyclic-AMP phosphodiesterase [Synechococcus sp. PCC 7336]|uniref:3',5'-cyclic-AMP phosphodiesterase n=1 Tax=Synechococcus sp. PCC 7336 TaxID=195250 RepID=UPI000346B05A|nr:3',5'-cyclic-AMP phosphodiesterase [Synechococcus sp. PCC 7336]